jgi:hypothetical protein
MIGMWRLVGGIFVLVIAIWLPTAVLSPRTTRSTHIDKVFIVHYTPLVGRKKKLLESLNKHNITAEWIESWDRDKLPADSFDRFFSRYRFIYKTHQQHAHLNLESMLPTELSVALKHAEIFKRVVENGYQYTLILEDDVILPPQFTPKLAAYMRQLPPEWDIFAVGAGIFGGCGEECKQRAMGSNVYRKLWNRSATSMHNLGYNNLFRSLGRLYPLFSHTSDFRFHRCIRFISGRCQKAA